VIIIKRRCQVWHTLLRKIASAAALVLHSVLLNVFLKVLPTLLTLTLASAAVTVQKFVLWTLLLRNNFKKYFLHVKKKELRQCLSSFFSGLDKFIVIFLDSPAYNINRREILWNLYRDKYLISISSQNV
jgi:hypothetical protein